MYNNDSELVIDLKDLIYRVLQRWRSVIVGAVIIGLLAGGFTALKGIVLVDTDDVVEKESRYNITLSNYEARGKNLKTDVQKLREAIDNQTEYNENSLLMKIDPMNEWVGTYNLYIDSKFKINPELTYQDVDLTSRLLNAYQAYLTGGALYDEILEKTNLVSDVQYLPEVLTADGDLDASSVVITYKGETKDSVESLLNLTQEMLIAKYDEVRDAVGDHEIQVLTQSVYTTVDPELLEQQKENQLKISEDTKKLQELDADLTKWEEETEPIAEFGTDYAVRQAVKMLILGGVVGFLLMCCMYAALYILGGKMQTYDDWLGRKIPVVGYLTAERKKRPLWKIDQWIDRYFGGIQPEHDLEQECKTAVGNMETFMREKGLQHAAMITDLAAPEILNKLVVNKNGIEIKNIGSILTDPDAASRLEGVSGVFFLGENGKTLRSDIQKEQILLESWGKDVYGAVVIG